MAGELPSLSQSVLHPTGQRKEGRLEAGEAVGLAGAGLQPGLQLPASLEMWVMYGFDFLNMVYMVFIWYLYGIYMVFIWYLYGIYMVFIWFIYGVVWGYMNLYEVVWSYMELFDGC